MTVFAKASKSPRSWFARAGDEAPLLPLDVGEGVDAPHAKGGDRLSMVVAEMTDEANLTAEFKKTFGLTVSKVKVDGTIEQREIVDNRVHLSER